MAQGPIEGELFRLNYLRPPEKQSDSPRARRRILQLLWKQSDAFRNGFVDAVQGKLGVRYPWSGMARDHEKYWTECDLGDFLSSITIYIRVTPDYQRKATLEAIREIIAEEELRYRVDDLGGVHHLVDVEFAQATDATLAGLAGPRFAAAQHALEDGLKGLAAVNPSGKTLIRGVFEAVESAFLVIAAAPKLDRISDKALDDYLRPKMLAAYAAVPNAADKVDRTLETFKKWVRSAHPYRHGAPFDQVHEAPIDEAVLSASIGMAFLRYMVQLPQRG